MDNQRVDPIIEYSHMVGKNTAELTASDMSKFMKWWMSQPIREDLYDMKKKKQATKKAEPKKFTEMKKEAVAKTKTTQAAKPTKKERIPMKKSMVVTKVDVKKLNVSGLTGKHSLDVQHGAKIGRLVNKDAVKKVAEGFEKFRQNKEEERQQQSKCLPAPVDINQIDDGEAEELSVQYRNRQWKSAKKQVQEEKEEVEIQEVEDDQEDMTEEELDDFIEENIEVEAEEERSEKDEQQTEEEQGEEERQEEVNVEELPPDDEEVCKMGLTALDVEALRYVLVEAMRASTEGAFEIPEEYLLTIESILEGLN